MSASEGTADLVDALAEYFSPPLARALLAATLRRAKLDGPELAPRAFPDAVAALEQALPTYIADAARREACVARLRRLVVAAAPPRPSSTAAPRIVPPRPASASTVIQIATADDVSNACEVGRDLAKGVGFPVVVQTKIATAIAELARNIVLYAISGELRIAAVDAPRRGLEVVAIDEGPGIRDLELVMTGPYKSRTGMGMGLRGAKRLMDTFDVDTSPRGTTVVTRKYLT